MIILKTHHETVVYSTKLRYISTHWMLNVLAHHFIRTGRNI